MALTGLTGLTGIAVQQRDIAAEPQLTPEERYGDTADPRHARRGQQAKPYPWESRLVQGGSLHGPLGPENQLLGDEQWFFEPAGDEWEDPTFDHTPSTRAAPWPKGILSGPIPGETPDAVAEQRRQSFGIHGIQMGAGLKGMASQAVGITQDEWVGLNEVNPGHSEQVPIPKQMMSSGYGWGTRDRVQSMARQNEYGFDSKHQLRRYATGSIPGNTMWMRPGGRPMVKNLAGPARPPIGLGSPFSGDDLGANFSIDGAYLQNVPTEYVPPPQPQLGVNPADTSADFTTVVEWY